MPRIITSARPKPSTEITTFEQILEHDPSLICLLRRARNYSGNCANAAWYGPDGIRAAITSAVGHGRTHGPSELKTSVAYDVAYRAVYAALPACNGCGCPTLEDVL